MTQRGLEQDWLMVEPALGRMDMLELSTDRRLRLRAVCPAATAGRRRPATANVGPACNAEQLLEAVHRILDPGPGHACWFLDGLDGRPVARCPGATADLEAQLCLVLQECGVDPVEQTEPFRIYVEGAGELEHLAFVPLDAGGGRVAVLVVAGRTRFHTDRANEAAQLVEAELSFRRQGAAQSTAACFQERARLRRELDELRALRALAGQLTSIKTRTEILTALAEWLRAPVILQSPHLAIQASAGAAAGVLAQGPACNEGVHGIASSPVVEGATLLLTGHGCRPARVVVSVRDNSQELRGYLVAGLATRGFGPTRQALELVAGIVGGSDLCKQADVVPVALQHRRLLEALVAGQLAEDDRSLAADAGLDLDTGHVAVAVSFAGSEAHVNRMVRLIQEAAARSTTTGARVLIAPVEEFVIALVPEPLRKGPEALGSEICRAAKENDLQVLVGLSPRAAAADLHDAVLRARWAAQILRTRHGGTAESAFIDFDSLGLDSLLYCHPRPGEVAAFVHRWLGPLINHDRRTRSTNLATLRQILRSPSKARAASALNVHLSTLRYRYHRIEALLGIRLDDADNQFNLNLALRVLTVAELLAPGIDAST